MAITRSRIVSPSSRKLASQGGSIPPDYAFETLRGMGTGDGGASRREARAGRPSCGTRAIRVVDAALETPRRTHGPEDAICIALAGGGEQAPNARTRAESERSLEALSERSGKQQQLVMQAPADAQEHPCDAQGNASVAGLRTRVFNDMPAKESGAHTASSTAKDTVLLRSR